MRKLLLLFILLLPCLSFGANIGDLTIPQHEKLGIGFPGALTEYYSYLTTLGVTKSRVDCNWSDREETQGVYTWSGLDSRVTAFVNAGIMPVVTFATDNNAAWAAPIVDAEKDAVNQVPVDLTVWQAMVTACAARYGDNVLYYSIVNEWPSQTHQGGGWAGTMEELIDFTNATYSAIKVGNPNASLILGAWPSNVSDIVASVRYYLDYGIDTEIRASDNSGNVAVVDLTDYITTANKQAIRSYYRVLNESNYDYLGVHLYGPVSHNTEKIAFLNRLVPNKTLVALECGGPNQAWETVTNDKLFNTTLELYLDALSRDVEFLLWFKLYSPTVYNGDSSLTWGNAYIAPYDSDTLDERGSAWGHMIASIVLENMTDITIVDDQLFKITRSDGIVYVGWGTGTFTLPDGFTPAQRINITNTTSGTFSLGTTPSEGEEIELGTLPTIISSVTLGS